MPPVPWETDVNTHCEKVVFTLGRAASILSDPKLRQPKREWLSDHTLASVGIKGALNGIERKAETGYRRLLATIVFSNWSILAHGTVTRPGLCQRILGDEIERGKRALGLYESVSDSTRDRLDRHFVKKCPKQPVLARLWASPFCGRGKEARPGRRRWARPRHPGSMFETACQVLGVVQAVVSRLRTMMAYVVDDSMHDDRKSYLQGVSQRIGESFTAGGKTIAAGSKSIRRFLPKRRSRKGASIRPLPIIRMEDGTFATSFAQGQKCWQRHFGLQEHAEFVTREALVDRVSDKELRGKKKIRAS